MGYVSPLHNEKKAKIVLELSFFCFLGHEGNGNTNMKGTFMEGAYSGCFQVTAAVLWVVRVAPSFSFSGIVLCV